ncbi:signal peptidase I [Propionibacteriaceae bacterium G1746]
MTAEGMPPEDAPRSGPTPDDPPAADDAQHRAEPVSAGRRLARGLRELVIIVVLALIISAGVRAFIGQVFVIPSASMEDTVLVGDRVVAVKLVDIQRGDIIVFRDPGGWLDMQAEPPTGMRKVAQFIGVLPDTSTNHLLKRVIGMPGDTIVCCDAQGRLSINGYSLDESSYLRPGSDPATIPFKVVVPADRIFVLGDNRNASRDSRCHLSDISNNGQPQGMGAFVPLSDVVGPALLRVAPLDRVGTLKRPAVFDSVPVPTAPAPAKPVIEPVGVGC